MPTRVKKGTIYRWFLYFGFVHRGSHPYLLGKNSSRRVEVTVLVNEVGIRCSNSTTPGESSKAAAAQGPRLLGHTIKSF
jgi:hypothetical protein